MTPTLEEIERLVALTKQDTEEAWRAADILDKNNQFRDWLIQEVKILNAAILGWRVVEEIFKEKVKSLENDLTILEKQKDLLIKDKESLKELFASRVEMVKSLEACRKIDQETIGHLTNKMKEENDG